MSSPTISVAELQDEEFIVLQEIPPRCLSIDSVEKISLGSKHKKKNRVKFNGKRLSQAFLHLFVCCVAPTQNLLETKKYENKKSDKRDLSESEVVEDGIMKNVSLENRPELSQVSVDEEVVSVEERNVDQLLKEQKNVEHNGIDRQPLFLEISEDVNIPLSTMNSSAPSVHSEYKKWLLDPILEADKGKKCLVLDLDETLVHSSFKIIHQADFIIPVKIDSSYHNVYVIKRPGVDCFMKRMGELFEIVVFTASLAKYADPVLDMLDIHHVVKHRLFRESCFNHQGNYVKNLSQLGRELKNVLIIDNSPASYIFHPTHAVPISSWFNDAHDTELLDLIPFLEDLTTVPDVTTVLDLGLT